MRSAVSLALLLCACHTHTRIDVVHVEGGRSLAALLGLSLLAAGYESERAGTVSEARGAPELDASRKVSEQDCTKPLDYSLGNIRCK